MPSTQPLLSLADLANVRREQGVDPNSLQRMLTRGNQNQDDEMVRRVMEVMHRQGIENNRVQNEGEYVAPAKQPTKRRAGVLESIMNLLSARPVVDELEAVQREFRGNR